MRRVYGATENFQCKQPTHVTAIKKKVKFNSIEYCVNGTGGYMGLKRKK